MPSNFNYTITTAGRVDKLLNLIFTNKFYFIFGKTSPWDTTWGSGVSDNNPPIPEKNLASIPEAFIYKKALKVFPVVQSGCGQIPFNSCSDITVNGKKWTPVPLEDKESQRELLNIIEPRHLYISVEIAPNEYTQTSFRAIGLTLNPVPNLGVALDQVKYSPNQISKPGILYWVSFGTPLEYLPSKSTQIEILLSV